MTALKILFVAGVMAMPAVSESSDPLFEVVRASIDWFYKQSPD